MGVIMSTFNVFLGDGVIDEEEFEFTLSDGFDISPNDCRIAFRIFTQVRPMTS